MNNKKTYCQTTLTALQMQSLNTLITSCRQSEPLHLGFPEDGSLFLMTCDGKETLSCLIVCKVEKDLWECYAFTRPDCRRKGLFSELLEKLCQTAPEDTELVFLSDHQSFDALAAFSALEMDLWRTEYQMEYLIPKRPKRPLSPASCSASPSHPPFAFPSPSLCPLLCREEFQDENGRGWLFSVSLPQNRSKLPSSLSEPPSKLPASLPEPPSKLPASLPETPSALPANPVGSCQVFAYAHMRFYLCHVEIQAEFRGLGLGTWLIKAVIAALPENARVFLQVAADNTAAVKLYKKTGFHITETLSYYLY